VLPVSVRPLVPPIALIGLKSYFGHGRTREWFEGLVGLVDQGRADGLTLVVIPSATALATLAGRAAEAGIVLAAQDCSRYPAGAWTGELPATLLAEVGAGVVEVGHVERRHHLGDTDEVVAAKVQAVTAAGLVPMVCVGEHERGAPAEVAAEVVRQMAAALDGTPPATPLLVAYEPEWAIGASDPAPTAYVAEVARRLRAWLERYPAASLIYGGAAGPGTYRDLAGVLDGLGLGRRVHDIDALAVVLDEMRDARGGASEDGGADEH
jgi:triosephosphate isomerase